MVNSEAKPWESPRAFARRGIKSEREVRRDMEAGKVPGFWAGNTFVIDVEAYVEQIKQECLANAEGRVRA